MKAVLYLIVALSLFVPVLGWAQQPSPTDCVARSIPVPGPAYAPAVSNCRNSQNTTASGTSLTINNNVGGVTSSFEYIIAGAPASLSVTLSGCKQGGTCDTLDTYSTVGNSIRTPTAPESPPPVYDYYTVVPVWSGGTNVSFTVNTTLTIANNGSGGGGSGNVTPSPQYEVAVYPNAGSAAQVAGAPGVTVDSTQTALNAQGGLSSGADPPAVCAPGSLCTSQVPTHNTPVSGVNSFDADSVNNAWYQTLGTNTAVPVPNAFASPLVESAAGGVSLPIQGNGTKVQAAAGTYVTGHCLNYDVNGNAIDAGTSCIAPTGLNSFVDFSVPTGTINGVNATFTLASVPNPASSLILRHNGLIMVQSTDYTLSSSTITFASGAIPQSGDTLNASYRTATATNFADFEVPTGTINGSNGTFTLANNPNPSSSLVLMWDGLTLVAGTDYTLSTATITFATGIRPQTGDTLVASYRY